MKACIVFLLCLLAFWTHSIEGKSLIQSRKGNSVRIVGGETANAGQFPSAAAIYVTTSSGTYFCGGSLISNQWVLTAAHCIEGGIAFRVLLGSTTLSGSDPNRVTLSTSNFLIHPEFDPETLENDVGLVHFHLPVTFTDYIQPIYLPTTHLVDYMSTTAIGWGQLNDDNAGLNNELTYVTLTTITNEECQLSYANQIFENMVCAAGNYNEGTCRGDSGSPLMITLNHHHWHMGIASFISTNGCESVDPSGYTRTYPYVDWIRNSTGIV